MPAKSAPFVTTTSSETLTCEVDGVAVQPTVIFGWSIAETTGTAGAKVRLHDGANAGGLVVSGLITLLQGESTRDPLSEAVQISSGSIFLEVVSGSVEGVVWWG